MRSTCARSPTSHSTVSASAPRDSRSWRAALSSAASRAQRASRQPWRANSRASAIPSPREPPVISTTDPASWLTRRRSSRVAATPAPTPAAAPIPAALAAMGTIQRFRITSPFRRRTFTAPHSPPRVTRPAPRAHLPGLQTLRRVQHDLEALLGLVAERPVAFGRVVDSHPVRDHEAGVDLAGLDALEQHLHIALHVRLAHLERKPLRERHADRELVDQPRVDARDRDGAALAARADRLPQRVGPVRFEPRRLLGAVVDRVQRLAVGFHADGVDARVRAAAASHLIEL